MCLLLILLAFGPRAALFILWLLQTARFEAAFPNFILPALGFIFLPWTTIAYIYLYPGGINGFEWFWIILTLCIDLGSNGGGWYKSQNRD